jgi:hypothetical protein
VGAVDSAPAETQAYESLTGALLVVLRELDDLKPAGRNPRLREPAKKPAGVSVSVSFARVARASAICVSGEVW